MNRKLRDLQYVIAFFILALVIYGVESRGVEKEAVATDFTVIPPSFTGGKSSWPVSSSVSETVERSTGNLLWEYQAGARHASVRFATTDLLYVETSDEIHAVDRGTGGPIWIYRGDSGALVWAQGDVAVIRDGNELKGFQIRKGRMLWSKFHEKPAVWSAAGDFLTMREARNSSTMLIIDPVDGSELLSLPAGPGPDNLMITDDTALVNSEESLIAYSIRSGSKKWSLDTATSGRCSLNSQFGSVFFASGVTLSHLDLGTGKTTWEQNFLNPVVSVRSVGSLVEVMTADCASLTLVSSTGKPVGASMATRRLIGSQDDTLVSYSICDLPGQGMSIEVLARSITTGKNVWRWTAASPGEDHQLAHIVVADGYVAVAFVTRDGELPEPESVSYCTELSVINITTGELISSTPFPEGMYVVDFDDGVAYVLTTGGSLQAVSVPGLGSPSIEDAAKEVRADLLIRTEPPETRIAINGKRIGCGPEISYAMPFGHHEIHAELAGYHSESRRIILDSVDAYTLRIVLSSSIEEQWSVPISAEAGTLNLGPSSVVVSSEAALLCYERQNGALRWQADGPVALEPILTGDMIYWASPNSVSAVRYLDGRSAWELSVEKGVRWIGFYSGTLLLSDGAGAIHGFSGISGAGKWSLDDAACDGTPRLAADTLYFLDKNKYVSAIAAAVGSKKWSRNIGGVSGRLIVFGASVYLFDSSSGDLMELSMCDGLHVGEPPSIAEPPVCGYNFLVYSRRLGICDGGYSIINAVSTDGSATRPVLHENQAGEEKTLFCPSNTVYVVEPGAINAYSLPSDDVRWSRDVDGLDLEIPLFVEEWGDVVFVALGEVLLGFDRESGATVWKSDLDSPIVDMSVHDGEMYFATSGSLGKIAVSPAE